MARALSCLVLALAALAAAPGAALAAATVELNPTIGILTVTGDADGRTDHGRSRTATS